MELCSIENAFPKVSGFDNLDRKGLESKPSKEERRAARKKAKQCKGPALDYINQEDGIPDPDRPAVKRMGDVPAFVSYDDAFPDLSGIKFEGFSNNNFGIPKLTSNSCTTNTEGLPKYFLRTDDDEEGFANYSGIQNDNPGYMMNPSIVGFEGSGVEKAGSLPAPEMSNEWKPTTTAKAKTAFLNPEPLSIKSIDSTNEIAAKPVIPKAPEYREPPMLNDQRDLLLKQIQELTKRLDQLERAQPVQNTQKELLMFVGTGIFLLVSFDIALRASR